MNVNWKKNFAIFMTSQAVSILGSSLVQFAITWHITLTTESGVAMTISILCGFLPTFLLSPFAGVWADRYNRKTLIMIADGCIALCTLAVAIVFMTGYQSLWVLYVASALRALGAAVQNPCVSAMLPDLVPEKHLTRANSINGTLQSAIMLVSPMLGGTLFANASITAIFFIDVVTAALAIGVMLLFLKVPHREKSAGGVKSDYFTEMKEGISYIFHHKFLWLLFLYYMLFLFMVSPVAFLTPLQATRNYGRSAWRLSAIEIVFSVGMLAGGLLLTVWGGFKNRTKTTASAAVFMAVCTIALGIPIPVIPYLAFMLLIGLTLPLFNTPATIILQERVDPAYMGRVFSVMTMLNTGMMPLSMLVFGFLADMVRIEYLLLGTGAVMLITALSIFRSRLLLEAGKPRNP